MINLAGNKDCDKYIIDELKRAEINVVRCCLAESEVRYTIKGSILNKKNEKISFRRAWTYWVATGIIDLEIAKKIYEHPEGKQTVRVGGDCTCKNPEGFYGIKYIDENRIELFPQEQYDKYSNNDSNDKYVIQMLDDAIAKGRIKLAEDITVGRPIIDCYHIDSQAGLLLFSLIIRDKLKL